MIKNNFNQSLNLIASFLIVHWKPVSPQNKKVYEKLGIEDTDSQFVQLRQYYQNR